ncbi:MAG: FadR family transcriptional regulator [Chloroflexota bacterium]|nr:MAG: FadR family transcriptional regulator [Chloroflexota bacterium]
MYRKSTSSEFMQYLAETTVRNGDSDRIPPLSELAKQLGVSVARLREQVEVAKALGLVEARPRTGMRRLPYSFFPATRESLSFAIETDPGSFTLFSDLRNHIEAAYWRQAVRLLRPEDKVELQTLMKRAWDKLQGQPIQIPHEEHRQLHMGIFRRLENPFVLGILEAYWEAYEAVGLSIYAEYDYLQRVWEYHQKMVDAICEGDDEAGFRALVEHTGLIHTRPSMNAI